MDENGTNANNVARDAANTLRDKAQELGNNIESRVDDLRGYAGDLDGRVRTFARERPVAAIACAAGLGFLVGRLASRT